MNESISTNSVYSRAANEAGSAALGRRLAEVSQTVNPRNPLKNQVLNVATWNVRTMTPHGSMEQITREAERLRIDVLGIAETHWMGNGREKDGRWELFYSGGDTRYAGVGIMVTSRVKDAITEVRPVSKESLR